MNPIAMMLPVMQSAQPGKLNSPPLQVKGENQSFSTFSKLLQEQGKTIQVQSDPAASGFDQEMAADEMMEKLLQLDVKELEETITELMAQDDLSEGDLSILEEMKSKLQELQQGTVEMPQQTDVQAIVEPVIQMASEQLWKDMIEYYQQPRFQDYVVTGRPVGEVRIVERINEDGTLVLKPVEPVEGEKRMKLQPIDPVIDFRKLHQDAKQILHQAENLLNNISASKDIPKVAPKMLELLQQWQKLVVQAGPDADKLSNMSVENKQLAGVWNQLVQAFQKRTGIQSQNFYNHDAKVTTNDITRWLNNAMETKFQMEKPVQQAPATAQVLPMNKVEQFVIHLNQSQQTQSQPVDKQLVEQFQKIMDANRITNLQNSRGQVAITLKPHNLGEMLVRFTQVNGEMMVKILVTSESAKKMLEGNIQQLRSMFSPHQVVIDRQEVLLTENQESQKQQERNEQQGKRDEAQTGQQQQQSDNESFLTIFEELIVNEEV